MRAGEGLRLWLGDLALALRRMRNAPGFTAVVVLTLALGIGGATALFSVVAAVTLRPLPYPDVDRLVHVWATWPGGSGNVSFPDYAAVREQVPAFEAVTAYEPWGGVALTDAEPPLPLDPSFVTGEYLAMLGAKAVTGRLLGGADDLTTHQPLLVVSHALWQRRWGGDPEVVGRAVELNGQPFTVAGVMPAGFRDLGLAEGGPPVDVWLPVGAAESLLGQAPLSEPVRIYWILGRLRPGATLAQAQQQLDAVAARLQRERPSSHEGYELAAQPLRERLHGPYVKPATLLLVAAALLLVVACVNLAATLGTRLARRRPEIVVRVALGATTRRLLRQLLVEAAALAVAGGLAGCLVAWALVKLVAAWVAANLSTLVDVRLDGAALAFAAMLVLATCVLLAVAPALEGRRASLAGTLRGAGRDGAALGGGRGARALVAVQVALTCVLLVGAGLMLRTLDRLARRDVGFPTAGVLTFQLELTGARYAEPPARVAFAQRLDERLARLPGVEDAVLLGPARLANSTWIVRVRPAERPARTPEDYTMLFRHSVNPGALAKLGVPLLAGREIDERDHAQAPLVAVVSATVAREMWPGADPLGRTLLRADPTLPPITVVGVAGDVKHRHRYSLDDVRSGLPLAATGPQRDVYFPYAQRPNPTLTWALRLAGDADPTLAGVQKAVAALDPDVPVIGPTLLDERLAAQEGAPGAIAALLGAFAGFGLLLGAVGVYGVVAQTLERRARELGMRMVLGAHPRRMAFAVVAAGAVPALAGALVGLLGSLATGPALAAMLVDVSSSDPLTLVLVPVVLLAVALAAAAGPARRVLRGEPLRALRGE